MSRRSVTEVLRENQFSRKRFIVRKTFRSLIARYSTLMHVVSTSLLSSIQYAFCVCFGRIAISPPTAGDTRLKDDAASKTKTLEKPSLLLTF